jgi:peptidyl-prolyl cis-trans isomerase D
MPDRNHASGLVSEKRGYMAKRDTNAIQTPTKKQLAIRKRDQERQRWVLFGIAGIAALVILVLIFGFIQVYILQPNSPIAKVDGVPISNALYQKMYRFQSYQFTRNLAQMQQQQAQYAGDPKQKFMYDYLTQNLQQLQSRQASMPQDVLSTLIDDQLIRKEAAKRGITVTPDDVQKELQRQFGYDPNPPTPTATPTLTATQVLTITPTPTTAPMTADDFKKLYAGSLSEFQKVANLTDADFREILGNSLMRDKLQKVLETEVPTMTEQIHASHILIATKQPTDTTGLSPEKLTEMQKAADAEAKAKAESALKRVTTGGEDFAKVAAEVSDDTGSKDKGGDLDWHPRGDMVPEFEAVAWKLQPGQIYTDVVQSQYGYHVIKLDEYDKNHPLSAYALQTRQGQALDNWLATARQSAKIENFWSADRVPAPLIQQSQGAPLPSNSGQ